MTAFPHMRVVGMKIQNPTNKTPKNHIVVDEILAIDPMIEPSFTVLDNEINRQKSRICNQDSQKNQDIEKCIRITSGFHKSYAERSATIKKNKPVFKFTDVPQISGKKFLFEHSTIDSDLNFKIKSATASTNINKSNEILLEKRARMKISDNIMKSSKSATLSKINSKPATTFLPSLQNNEVIGRSISAVNKRK